jgi:hypothetical protein
MTDIINMAKGKNFLIRRKKTKLENKRPLLGFEPCVLNENEYLSEWTFCNRH